MFGWKESLKHMNKMEQSSRGVPMKRCSENMLQIYRRTPMPKCDFNKLLCKFIEMTLRHRVSPVNLVHIFKKPFLKNTSGWLLLTRIRTTGIYIWQNLCVSSYTSAELFLVIIVNISICLTYDKVCSYRTLLYYSLDLR